MNLENFSKYEFYKWAKYQWEFMRRSHLFEKIHDRFLEAHGEPSPYVDRSLSFDEIIAKYQKDEPGLIGLMTAFQRMLPASVTSDSEKAVLKIEIDFEQINSLRSLKAYVGQIIDTHYKVVKKLKIIDDKKKRNFADFDRILQAGDLYIALKKKGSRGIYGKIADVLYPKDSDRRAAEAKACQRVEEYNRLVNGGFFNLSYP